MSWDVSPWVYPVWDSLGFLDLGDYFLPHLREVFNYYLLKYFLMPFLFVFFFWDFYDSMLGCLIFTRGFWGCPHSFNSFCFFSLCFTYSHHSIFHLTFPSFCLSYSTDDSLQSPLFIIDRLSLIMTDDMILYTENP